MRRGAIPRGSLGQAQSPRPFVVDLPGPHLQKSQRWVRVRVGGRTIAESHEPILFLDYGTHRRPTYLFCPHEVDQRVLVDSAEHHGRRWWSVVVDDVRIPNGAYQELSADRVLAEIREMFSFSWSALEWLEEDERIYFHARDPAKRIDILDSSRHVVVSLDGEVLAESREPKLLFETYLPVRFYLRKEEVQMGLLARSSIKTECPYKGVASHWSATVSGRDIGDVAWSYEDPFPESLAVKGLVCFFDERVDTTVDGRIETRPVTPWS